MNKDKVIKAGLGYTIGNVLVKGIGFISLPIFSRVMTTEQFGVYNVFVSYESILFVVVGLAMHTSIQSANIEYKNKINEYTSSISIMYIINMLILLAVSIIFGNQLSKAFDFEKSIIYMLVIYSFSGAILSLYNYKISLQYAYKKYIVISLINSIGNVFLSLLLMLSVFEERREYGRIVGTTTSALIVAMIILIIFYKDSKPKVNKKYWRFAVEYSLPVVPHGISQVFLAQIDRIMIRNFVGDAVAGIYSFAGYIKLILTVVTDSITTAWRTWFFSEMKEGKIKEIQMNAKYLCGVYTIFAVGLIALTPELIYVLGGKTYSQSVYVAIPMIVDAFFLFLYSVIVQCEYYTRKTKYIMMGTVIAAVIDVIGNYIFIQRYGFIAAAYTTLFAYACYLVMHIAISYKLVMFFVVPMKWLIFYIFLVVMFAVLNLFLVNLVIIRWTFCLAIIIPLALFILNKSGYLIIIKDRILNKK